MVITMIYLDLLTSDQYGNVYYTGYFKSSILHLILPPIIKSNNSISKSRRSRYFYFKYNKTETPMGKKLWFTQIMNML